MRTNRVSQPTHSHSKRIRVLNNQYSGLLRPLFMASLFVAGSLLLPASNNSQAQESAPDGLSTKEIMNAMLTPMTATIWGAYELETAAEWLAVENAALTVIAAGSLLAGEGADATQQRPYQEAQWQEYNAQMIFAARKVLDAVAAKDEEALSSAGNDLLYPPCESCHQQYQQR